MSTSQERRLQRKIEKLQAENEKLTKTLLAIGESVLKARIATMNDEQEATFYERIGEQPS